MVFCKRLMVEGVCVCACVCVGMCVRLWFGECAGGSACSTMHVNRGCGEGVEQVGREVDMRVGVVEAGVRGGCGGLEVAGEVEGGWEETGVLRVVCLSRRTFKRWCRLYVGQSP